MVSGNGRNFEPSLKFYECVSIDGNKYFSISRTARDHCKRLRELGFSIPDDQESSEVKTFSLWTRKSPVVVRGRDVIRSDGERIVESGGRKFLSQDMHDTLCTMVRICEACDFLEVSRRSVYNYIDKGRLTPRRMPGVGKKVGTNYLSIDEVLKIKEERAPIARKPATVLQKIALLPRSRTITGDEFDYTSEQRDIASRVYGLVIDSENKSRSDHFELGGVSSRELSDETVITYWKSKDEEFKRTASFGEAFCVGTRQSEKTGERLKLFFFIKGESFEGMVKRRVRPYFCFEQYGSDVGLEEVREAL